MSSLKRLLFFSLGLTSLLVSILAGAVPGLPGFPFLVLSLWAFAKSSKKFHDWLLGLKIVQRTLEEGREFLKTRTLSPGAKISVILLAWAIFAIGLFFEKEFTLQIKLFAGGAALCTLAVLFSKTKKTR